MIEHIQEYWGWYLIGLAAFFLFIIRLAKKRKLDKKKPIEDVGSTFSELINIDISSNLLDSLKRQQEKAENQLKMVQLEWGELEKEEKQFLADIAEQKARIDAKKNELGVRFETWKAQLQKTIEMIIIQKKMNKDLGDK